LETQVTDRGNETGSFGSFPNSKINKKFAFWVVQDLLTEKDHGSYATTEVIYLSVFFGITPVFS
jgi:hypothetical protein